MGVNSNGFYPNVDKDDIKNFIKLIAKNVSLRGSGIGEDYSILSFSLKNEKRIMNLFDRYYEKEDYIRDKISRYNITRKEAEDWWEEDLVPDAKSQNIQLGKNGTFVSLGNNDLAVEVVYMIAYYFGGYVDEKESGRYNKIEKNHKEIVKIIFGE